MAYDLVPVIGVFLSGAGAFRLVVKLWLAVATFACNNEKTNLCRATGKGLRRLTQRAGINPQQEKELRELKDKCVNRNRR